MLRPFDQSVENRSEVQSLLSLVKGQSTNPIVDFDTLQTPELMPHWKEMIIVKKIDDDFEYVFWGSRVADIYGSDISGKRLSSLEIGPEIEAVFRDFYDRVLDTKKPQYILGDLDWVDRKYRLWWMVMLPLSRSGTVNECVSWVYSEM